MTHSRRDCIQNGLAFAGAAGLMLAETTANAASPQPDAKAGTTMADQQATVATSQQASAGATNVLGGDKFDPAKWLVVSARTFEDLKVGDALRAPSRTFTDARTSEFQAISGDKHPRHYNTDMPKTTG